MNAFTARGAFYLALYGFWAWTLGHMAGELFR